MKKATLIYLLLSILLLSCNSGNEQGEYLRCNLNGQPFEDFDNAAAYISATNYANFAGNENNIIIYANVPNVTGIGTYPISIGPNAGEGELGISMNGNNYKISQAFPPSHGTITITALSNAQSTLPEIRGTFSGVAYNVSGSDSVIITNGEFSGW